jgi:hypothetical protein
LYFSRADDLNGPPDDLDAKALTTDMRSSEVTQVASAAVGSESSTEGIVNDARQTNSDLRIPIDISPDLDNPTADLNDKVNDTEAEISTNSPHETLEAALETETVPRKTMERAMREICETDGCRRDIYDTYFQNPPSGRRESHHPALYVDLE